MLSAESFPVISTALQVMAALFVVLIGLGVLTVIILFVIDVTQTRSAIRRNYPVVGRFRYFFEHMGEFFRQYFFAMGREELPFNRAQRSWACRAAKNIDNTVGFGSTRDLRPTGTVLFVNCPTGITTHNKRLQKGLNQQDKAVRVAHYARNMVYEVGIIAHSCGVREPRQLKRFHARVVTGNGLSIPLSELHPDVTGPEVTGRVA